MWRFVFAASTTYIWVTQTHERDVKCKYMAASRPHDNMAQSRMFQRLFFTHLESFTFLYGQIRERWPATTARKRPVHIFPKLCVPLLLISFVAAVTVWRSCFSSSLITVQCRVMGEPRFHILLSSRRRIVSFTPWSPCPPKMIPPYLHCPLHCSWSPSYLFSSSSNVPCNVVSACTFCRTFKVTVCVFQQFIYLGFRFSFSSCPLECVLPPVS